MLSSFHALLCFLSVFVSVVSANTETIRLVFQSPEQDQSASTSSSSPIAPTIQFLSGDQLSNHTDLTAEPTDRHLTVIQPTFEAASVNEFLVKGNIGEMYEVRVCWPATFPSQHQLTFADHFDGTGIIRVSTSLDYYSQYPELMKSPRKGAYEIVVNKVLKDALPTDIVTTLGFVLASVGAAYLTSGYVVSSIFS